MVLVLVIGCEAEESVPLNTGSAYFPLKKGIYQVYAVNEIRYSAVAEPETLTYELMTEVVDSFPSAKDTYIYVIHRSRRSAETEPWEVLDTWSARKDKTEAIVSEGNTPFVKVVFPIRDGARWNGNAFNALGDDEYELKDIHQPFAAGGMTFEKTLTIEQEQNEDPIVFNDARMEVYARDVGMVYRQTVQLYYCTDDDCLGQQKIAHGIDMKMVIKQYGRH